MSEETITSTEETTAPEPTIFNWVAGQTDGQSQRSGPVEVVYTPEGWIIKE